MTAAVAKLVSLPLSLGSVARQKSVEVMFSWAGTRLASSVVVRLSPLGVASNFSLGHWSV